MNRAQFMEQLEKLLSDISEEERQEALDYYESYFDDAGEDQEANVIRELGSCLLYTSPSPRDCS